MRVYARNLQEDVYDLVIILQHTVQHQALPPFGMIDLLAWMIFDLGWLYGVFLDLFPGSNRC